MLTTYALVMTSLSGGETAPSPPGREDGAPGGTGHPDNSVRQAAKAADAQALSQVRDVVERFTRGRTDVEVQDVVQEAVARLLENRSRLEPAAWAGYAVACAGNLLRDRDREAAVRRRHEHRLHAPDLQATSEELVLRAEESEALRRAIATLPAQEASLLSAHHGAQQRSNRSVAPATAARLARARAKLRVAYLLEHAQVPLPTARCRPVLEALSTGDRRRQERLGAGRHLIACQPCISYAPALVERRRALAAVHPLAWLAFLGGAAWAALRRNPQTTAASGTVVVAAAALGMTVALQAPADRNSAAPIPPSAAPAVASDLTVDGEAALPRRSGVPAPMGAVVASGVVVQDVPADEGFWVGSDVGQRWWVQLVGSGESTVQVQTGDRVSFVGQAVRTAPDFAAEVGLTATDGAAELEELGVYLRVRRPDLVLLP